MLQWHPFRSVMSLILLCDRKCSYVRKPLSFLVLRFWERFVFQLLRFSFGHLCAFAEALCAAEGEREAHAMEEIRMQINEITLKLTSAL